MDDREVTNPGLHVLYKCDPELNVTCSKKNCKYGLLEGPCDSTIDIAFAKQPLEKVMLNIPVSQKEYEEMFEQPPVDTETTPKKKKKPDNMIPVVNRKQRRQYEEETGKKIPSITQPLRLEKTAPKPIIEKKIVQKKLHLTESEISNIVLAAVEHAREEMLETFPNIMNVIVLSAMHECFKIDQRQAMSLLSTIGQITDRLNKKEIDMQTIAANCERDFGINLLTGVFKDLPETEQHE